MGGISCDARIDLHFFNFGSVNVLKYMEDILLNCLVPYVPFVGADSFMQDNASQHVAWRMLKFLEEVEIA